MPSPNQAQAKRDQFMELLNEYVMQEVSYNLADGAQATEAKKDFDWKRRKAHKAILEFVFPAKEDTDVNTVLIERAELHRLQAENDELRAWASGGIDLFGRYSTFKAKCAELEAMLDAIGAGGVGESIKPQIQADTAPAAWAICSDDGTAIRLWSRDKATAQEAADKLGLPLVVLYAAPQQPVQQKPVAWRVHPFDYGVGSDGVYALTMRTEQVEMWQRKEWKVEPLYTAPQPARQPLTKAQVLDLWEQTYVQRGTSGLEFARAVEAAHGITGGQQ